MHKVIPLLIAAALAGCSMAPKYERPATPIPQQIGAAQTGELNMPEWKTYFGNADLQAVIDRALKNNRDLRVAVGRVEEARAQYGITRADRLPSFNAAGGGSINRTPESLSQTGQSTISRRYDANLSLLSYELDFWGRVKSLSDAALSSYLGTVEAERSARLSLIAGVASSYYSARALAEQADFSRKTQISREENLKLVKGKVAAGSANRLDLLQAESLVDSARVSTADLERQAETARNALDLLVGEPVKLPEVSGKGLKELPVAPHLPAGIDSSVLLNRPDVLSAEASLRAANANIGAARAAFFPRITLAGSAGTASNELGDLFSNGTRAWSFVPSISLPIFNGGRNIANLDLANVRKNIAVAQYEKTIQQAFQDVANVLADQRWLTEQLTHQEQLAARQAERLKLAEARYKSGIAGYLDVLDAQREHYAAEQALIGTRRAQLSAAAQAYKVLGGI